MTTLPKALRRNLLAAAVGLSLSAPITLQAAQNDVVLLWGTQTEGELMMGFEGFGQSAAGVTPARACFLARHFIEMNVPMPSGEFYMMVAMMAGQMGGMEGMRAAAGAIADLNACADDPEMGSSGGIWLIFTSCSMIMGAGTHWLRWTVPPFTEEASMIALDTTTGQGVDMPLETRMEQLEAVNKTGEVISYNVSGPASQKPLTLGVSVSREFRSQEFTAYKYDFDYSGNIEVVPGGMSSPFMPKVSLSATGHSWVIPDAPGADVIATFYSNFRDYVAPAAGMESVMSAMIRQMADIATKGIPVETQHKSSVGGGSMMAGFGGSSTSTSTIKRLMLLPGKASGQCARTEVPEGIEVMDINQMMAGGSGQAGAGNSGVPGMTEQQAADMSEAMSAMQDAMSQMTPEQREMMQSMGIAIPGQAAAANPAGGAAAGTATQSSRSSAALTTSDLTQTVQLHLDALGYDVGRTDGTTSLETTIAISQFQAEKGMKVTGEVSPQLIGILAAEVDSR